MLYISLGESIVCPVCGTDIESVKAFADDFPSYGYCSRCGHSITKSAYKFDFRDMRSEVVNNYGKLNRLSPKIIQVDI